jgi:exodeoxyribonuclease VII large subunit
MWILGEAGRIQRPAAGHVYFTLKDPDVDATIDCVLYRREAMRYGRMLREGGLLELRGQASFYAPRGRLQWIVSEAREAGVGQHLLRLKQLKEKLQAEGLFSAERKRPLPESPKTIGVVTSRSGAAFSDIVKVVSRRAKVRLVLSSCLVQGEQAAPSIISAMERIERLPELDVLIIGRGGGSKDDLMVWNDEAVVRRIARCRVPVVCAVGHEIDVSLAELVSDMRAATPSQAAELVTPDQNLSERILRRELSRLKTTMQNQLVRKRIEYQRLRRGLGEPRVLLGQHQQLLHELSSELESVMRVTLAERSKAERSLAERLQLLHPKAVLLRAQGRLAPLVLRLAGAGRASVERRRRSFDVKVASMDALSPLKVLGRGYALALDGQGKPLLSTSQVSVGDEVEVRLHQGRLITRVAEASLDFDEETPHVGFSSASEASREIE